MVLLCCENGVMNDSWYIAGFMIRGAMEMDFNLKGHKPFYPVVMIKEGMKENSFLFKISNSIYRLSLKLLLSFSVNLLLKFLSYSFLSSPLLHSHLRAHKWKIQKIAGSQHTASMIHLWDIGKSVGQPYKNHVNVCTWSRGIIFNLQWINIDLLSNDNLCLSQMMHVKIFSWCDLENMGI